MKISGLLKSFDLRFIKFYLHHSHNGVRKAYKFYSLIKKNPTLKIEEDVQIKSPDRLIVGKNVQIQKGTILHCGGMEWCNHEGYIKIGDDSIISPYCIFYGAGGIEIGKRSGFGPNVMIFSNRLSYDARLIGQKNEKMHFKKVIIGDDAQLYSGVIVNIGVSIGNGAVVGAGSLVLSDIPPKEVWAGIPAKFIKKRDEDVIQELAGAQGT